MAKVLPPVAVALSFVDAINWSDTERLVALMSETHTLKVFDESPTCGLKANRAAWTSYLSALPLYVIHPQRLSVQSDAVYTLGSTTGSHLRLTEQEELKLTLIWKAVIEERKVALWQLILDTDEHRRNFDLR